MYRYPSVVSGVLCAATLFTKTHDFLSVFPVSYTSLPPRLFKQLMHHDRSIPRDAADLPSRRERVGCPASEPFRLDQRDRASLQLQGIWNHCTRGRDGLAGSVMFIMFFYCPVLLLG